MANTIISPNMNLPIPVVGTDPGPDWANNLNNSLTLVDQHDHSTGNGVQVTPAGLNINADLPINGNNLLSIKAVRFNSQNAVLVGVLDLDEAYVVNGDLYFNDGVGNNVRITQNGAVAGTPGSIANLVSPASASYSASTQTFIWQSDVNTAANSDGGSITLRNLTISSFGLTLNPPSAMGADLNMTLPASIPVSGTNVMTMDSTGQMATTTTITSLQVPAGSVLPYFGSSAPSGFLLCDGSAVSRTTYATLYAVTGDANGNGNGTTTFNLPDLRGMFLRGVSGASGRDPDASSRTAAATGGNTGNNVGSVQQDAFESHQHTYPGSLDGSASGSSTTFVVLNPATPPSTSAVGGNETRPINAYCLFIIKT